MKIEKLTSRDNPKLKHARAVRDGKVQDSIFIEGSRLCAEAVSSRVEIETVFVTHRFLESESFGETVGGTETGFVLPEQVLESIADTRSPQGIVIIAKRPTFEYGLVEPDSTSIFLYQINNPANLGAVVRTAEAAGVKQILLSAGSADPFSPKALRAAMGSAFRTKISEGCILETVVDRSKRNGIEVLAVDANGKSIYSMGNTEKPQMFVFGSEAHGLPDVILTQADSVVSIPMNPPVESLNLAVSCGIILFEARRQLSS
jgi:RNA methyltransferase, TrmH family